jgi:hypothetical protein
MIILMMEINGKLSGNVGCAVEGIYCLRSLEHWIVSSNPTRGMDVCVRLYCVYVVLSVGKRPCDGLITRPMSSTVCVMKSLRN